MFQKTCCLVAITFLTVGISLSNSPAIAQTPIQWAEIQKLINRVRLKMSGQRYWQDAKTRDRLQRRGDEVVTYRQSQADLRLSDTSLVRMRSNTRLRFEPNSRNIQQMGGTALYIIRPGQGQTNIRTKQVSAGIRGSALFVRMNEETGTTIVGALTNNPEGPMEIETADGSQKKALQAGEMAVVRNGAISIFQFDLQTFYQTSPMVRDFDLSGSAGQSHQDPTVAAVQEETQAAIAQQEPVQGTEVVTNPEFLQPSDSVNPEQVGEAQDSAAAGVTAPLNTQQVSETPESSSLSPDSDQLSKNPVGATTAAQMLTPIVNVIEQSPLFNQPSAAPLIAPMAAITSSPAVPVVQQPIVQQPIVQQPIVQQPIVQQPVIPAIPTPPAPVMPPAPVAPPVVQQPVAPPPVAQQPVIPMPTPPAPVMPPAPVAPPVVQQPVIPPNPPATPAVPTPPVVVTIPPAAITDPTGGYSPPPSQATPETPATPSRPAGIPTAGS
jgi:hypothetical protein